MTGRLTAAGHAVAALVEAVQAGELSGHGGQGGLSQDELSGLLAQVRTLQARLEFVGLAVVREVDARGSFVADGALGAAAWARMHTRMNPGEASAAVRTARTLGSGELPGTAAALAAGVIDPAHVRAITAAVADAPPGAAALIEDEALAVAAEADPRTVAALMARFRHALDPDAADAAALARHARRGITLSPTPDGTVHLRGLADEVTGGLLMTAIDAANPLVSGDTRTAAQSRIDALAEICRKYLASPDAPMSGGGHAHLIVTVDQTTVTPTTNNTGAASVDPEAQANAHARAGAGAGAEGFAAAGSGASDSGGSNGEGDRDGASGGDLDWGAGLGTYRPTGTSPTGNTTTGNTMTGNTMTGDGATVDGPGSVGAAAGAAYGPGPGGTLSWVGPIAGSTARRVGCDADVTYVGIDHNGQATLLGREARFFTWAQRKAMIARDGDRCAVPFCDRPISWADGHHLLDWGLGGPTTIDNGALPCAAHHPLCHEGGWALLRLPDGRYLFRHRDGKTIGPEPYPPGHNRPPPHNRPRPHNRQ